jgi:hypothetical protein
MPSLLMFSFQVGQGVRTQPWMAKHGEPCRTAGMAFIPMPVETLGGWHEQTVAQMKKMGSALARQAGQDESEAIRHLAQRTELPLFPPQK